MIGVEVSHGSADPFILEAVTLPPNPLKDTENPAVNGKLLQVFESKIGPEWMNDGPVGRENHFGFRLPRPEIRSRRCPPCRFPVQGEENDLRVNRPDASVLAG